MASNVKDVSELKPNGQATYYRELANDALREAAKTTDPAARGSYLLIAANLQRLALTADAGTDGG